MNKIAASFILVGFFCAVSAHAEAPSDGGGFSFEEAWKASDAGQACLVVSCLSPANNMSEKCFSPLRRFASMSQSEKGAFISKCPEVQVRATRLRGMYPSK